MLKSSGDASETIDSLDIDLVDNIPASKPSLPIIICPSTSPSMCPKSASKLGLDRLRGKLDRSRGLLTSSSKSLLKSAT